MLRVCVCCDCFTGFSWSLPPAHLLMFIQRCLCSLLRFINHASFGKASWTHLLSYARYTQRNFKTVTHCPTSVGLQYNWRRQLSFYRKTKSLREPIVDNSTSLFVSECNLWQTSLRSEANTCRLRRFLTQHPRLALTLCNVAQRANLTGDYTDL